MLQQELARKEQLLRKAVAETGTAASRTAILTNGERDVFVQRVKELLAKIEAYL